MRNADVREARIDRWARQLQPTHDVHTLERQGDMTMASTPVTLAKRSEGRAIDYLVLAAVSLTSIFTRSGRAAAALT
jgi:hypothetical protein